MLPDPHRVPSRRSVRRGESGALLPALRSRRGGSVQTTTRVHPGGEETPAEGEGFRGGQVSTLGVVINYESQTRATPSEW